MTAFQYNNLREVLVKVKNRMERGTVGKGPKVSVNGLLNAEVNGFFKISKQKPSCLFFPIVSQPNQATGVFRFKS